MDSPSGYVDSKLEMGPVRVYKSRETTTKNNKVLTYSSFKHLKTIDTFL